MRLRQCPIKPELSYIWFLYYESTENFSPAPGWDASPIHHRVMPSIKFTGSHSHTRVERSTARVRCLAQEHNTMTPARTRAQAAVESSALTMRPPRLHSVS